MILSKVMEPNIFQGKLNLKLKVAEANFKIFLCLFKRHYILFDFHVHRKGSTAAENPENTKRYKQRERSLFGF